MTRSGESIPTAVDTAGSISGVPDKPATRSRHFRIPDDLYEAAQVKADERQEFLSQVVREALEEYVKLPGLPDAPARKQPHKAIGSVIADGGEMPGSE